MPDATAPRSATPVMAETDSECGYGYVRHGAYIQVAGTGLNDITLWRVRGSWIASARAEHGDLRTHGHPAATKDAAVNSLLTLLRIYG